MTDNGNKFPKRDIAQGGIVWCWAVESVHMKFMLQTFSGNSHLLPRSFATRAETGFGPAAVPICYPRRGALNKPRANEVPPWVTERTREAAPLMGAGRRPTLGRGYGGSWRPVQGAAIWGAWSPGRRSKARCWAGLPGRFQRPLKIGHWGLDSWRGIA